MKGSIKAFYLISLLSSLLLAGCATEQPRPAEQSVDLATEVGVASQAMLQQLGKGIARDKTVLATSFANIDNLQSSSTFGRLIGDTLAGDLVAKGFNVVEVRLRNNLFMQPRVGEFMLSRELRNVSMEHEAQAVLVGTYAIGGEFVYVNARLVDALNSRVLSSHDFRLPLNRDIRKMLVNSGR